jgi:hypothetical protein
MSEPANSEWNSKLQEEAASGLFQLVSQWVQKGVNWVKDKAAWEIAAKNYIHRWIDRWGQIQPLGADHPIPLHRIYVQVRAMPRSYLQRFASIQSMEASVSSGRRRPFGLTIQESRDYEPQPGMKIANEQKRLNILGTPGAGKSTFLRRLGLEALMPEHENPEIGGWQYKRDYSHAVIPVLLELRSLRSTVCADPEDIVALIAKEFATSGFPESASLVTQALERGFLLLLLDGVDEIPTVQLDTAVTAIRNFINSYPNCRYVLSCRTAFYRDWFTGFHDFVLSDFDDADIQHFARNWFTREDEVAKNVANHFVKLLSTEEHRATRELAGSPLLLTFLCLVYRKTQQFPPNRAQLYHKALRIYLEEWNASKLVHNERITQELYPEMELELLKDVAGPAFIENSYFFTGDELKSSIAKFIAKELNAPKSLSASQILETIAVRQGLFVERAQDIWTFSHLTIQEYLAAAWMLEEGQADEIIRKFVFEDRWREIFLLMSGLTRADNILALMMASVGASASDGALPDLWKMLSERAKMAWRRIESESRFESFRPLGPVCGQALLRARDLALMLDRARARELDMGRERESQRAQKRQAALKNALERVLDEAVDRTRDLNLDVEEDRRQVKQIALTLEGAVDRILNRSTLREIGPILEQAGNQAHERHRSLQEKSERERLELKAGEPLPSASASKLHIPFDLQGILQRTFQRSLARNRDLKVPRNRDRTKKLTRELVAELAEAVGNSFGVSAHPITELEFDRERPFGSEIDVAREPVFANHLDVANDAVSSMYLNRHCRVSILVCECKRAALRLSKEAWEEVCGQVLAAPYE